MADENILGILFWWLILAFIVANVGKNKKMGYWGLFGYSLLLSPLIGLIIGLASEKKATKADAENSLLKFHTMMEKGIITPEEYERRKQNVLGFIGTISEESRNITPQESEKTHNSLGQYYVILGVMAFLIVVFLLFKLK